MASSIIDLIVTICQAVGGLFLIMLGIWAYVIDRNITYRWAVIYLYYIFFGVFIIVQLAKLEILKRQFAFMNSIVGKALLAFFLGMFTCYDWFWLQTLTYYYFFCICLLYLILSLVESETSESKPVEWNKTNAYGTATGTDILPGESI